jgi:hypothetical protein
MTRAELEDIIKRIIKQIQKEQQPPRLACLYGDTTPGPTTHYAIGEES